MNTELQFSCSSCMRDVRLAWSARVANHPWSRILLQASQTCPDKPSRLANLGSTFATRFECLGQLSNLEDAISRQREAVDLTPRDHPQKPMFLTILALSFRNRFERLGELSDLEEAVSLFSHAACASVGSIAARFDASRQWILCARLLRHHFSFMDVLLPSVSFLNLHRLASHLHTVTGNSSKVPMWCARPQQ